MKNRIIKRHNDDIIIYKFKFNYHIAYFLVHSRAVASNLALSVL